MRLRWMRDIQPLLCPQYAYSILQLKRISGTQEMNLDMECRVFILRILLFPLYSQQDSYVAVCSAR